MSDVYDGLRLRTFGQKEAGTSTFSNSSLVSPQTPTLANPTRGFGLPTNNVIQTATEESTNLEEAQAANEQSLLSETIQQRSFSHDMSRMVLRRPQAKLTVGKAGDKYEQEADRVANQVMRMVVPDKLNAQSVQSVQDSLQRKCATCEQEEDKIQTKPSIQTATDGGLQAEDNIESRLNSSKGGGSALPDEVRSFMEPRFGADFSRVRVHTGGDAVQMSRELGAQAFTHGSHIYYGADKAPAKNELTAHELTHLVQQTQSVQRVPNPSPQVINVPPQTINSAPGELSPEEQAFFNLTSEALTQVSLVESQFSAWLSSITIPYALAWTSHKNALKAADQAAKEANALLIGVVLAAIPGGVGGTVGNAMKNLGAGAALVDGVKDLTKYGLREAGRAVTKSPGSKGDADPAGARPTIGGIPSSSIQGGSAFEAMPDDPLVWQNNTNKRSQNEVLIPAKQNILSWQNKVNNHDPNFQINFNPVEAIKSTLKLKVDKTFSLFSLPPIENNLKTSYEQGFLIDWINTEAAKSFTHVPSARDKAMDKLIKYGRSIGISDVDARLRQAGVLSSSEMSSVSAGGMMVR
ncbi:eCIS core domain-containing protein [Nostoc sp.]|uniref:eCIS core domain-containing protein n=1 Tax=Nostoc sp. TaxID=1180 RepID=UPI002FF640F2